MDSFENEYKNISSDKRTELISCGNHFFRKWCFSALDEGRCYTPAVIYTALGVGRSQPVLRCVGDNNAESFEISEMSYGLNNHIIAQDFKAVMNLLCCGIRFDERNNVIGNDYEYYNGVFKLNDGCYIRYLCELACMLDVAEYGHALYVTAFTAGSKLSEYIEMDNAELLKRLCMAAVRVCADNLSLFLYGENMADDEKYIYELLYEPKRVDDIIDGFCKCLELPIYVESRNTDEADVMGLYMFEMGMLLDKWFITPFGYYFRFITPYYSYSYSFEEELGFYVKFLNMKTDEFSDEAFDAAIYSPCTSYCLSELGAEFFNLDKSLLSEKEINEIRNYINIKF
jgi:hypothetical protein